MMYTLSCRDAGTNCDAVFEAKSIEELMKQAGKHAKEMHGFTDQQLNDPEMKKKIQSIVKVKEMV